MLKRQRRKSFVLIEVLVATGLFVLLLTAIFGIFWRTTKTNDALNKLRLANEQMVVTQAKLQSAFAHFSFAKSIRPYFFTEIDRNSGLPSLVFTLEDMPQANSFIAPDLLAKLYIEDEQLVLASFPHLKKDTGLPTVMQKEVLLSGVTDIKMEFFLPKEKEAKEEDETVKKPIMGSWSDSWLLEYNRPPALVKIELTKKNSDTFVLWFYIPQAINYILYDKG